MRLALTLTLLLTTVVHAEDALTLNDIPSVLQKIDQCDVAKPGWFNSPSMCNHDSWFSVGTTGEVTLFYKPRILHGDAITASGLTVNEALRNFAAKLNERKIDGDRALKAIAPLLPTQ